MIPGFLFDIAALPRFLIGVLPWWTALLIGLGLWFTAGSLRAAVRLVVFLAAITVGTFLAATTWLSDHTAVASEIVETDGDVR